MADTKTRRLAVKGNVLKTLAPVDASDAFREFFMRQRDVHEPPATTPLHVATLNGDLGRVQRLLAQKKADVSARDVNGYTALHHAALRGREQIARLLIEHGASVHVAAHDGSTPLHKAAQAGHVVVSQLLLEQDADTQATNAKGERPIDLCAMRKHTELTTLLRGYGGSCTP